MYLTWQEGVFCLKTLILMQGGIQLCFWMLKVNSAHFLQCRMKIY